LAKVNGYILVWESLTGIISVGYPGKVLRSTAVREMTSLRRLQFSQINSHRHVWVFKSPQHTLPKEVTKKHYGNRTTIKEITTCEVRTADPQFTVVLY
jgi:hypothetical protein